MLYDVAVIGAGPAGSTAAKFCAMRGLKTILLDRQIFPRPKTCGGGITSAAINTIGFPLPEHTVLGQVHVLRSIINNKTVHIPHPRPFMVITERSVFDNFLAEKAVEAGVEFQQNENVKGLTKEDRYFTIKTQHNSFKAKVLVGADGVHSAAAKLAGLNSRYRSCALCLTAEIPVKSNHSLDEIQINYDLLPKGYGWVFPKGDRLGLGVGCFTSSYGRLRKALAQLAVTAGSETPEIVKGHYIPYSGQSPECVGDGILLAGDAAGFVDPFTGEGIRYAIISGMMAGETLWNCYRNGIPPNKKNLAGYLDKCRQGFLRDLKYSYMLARTFFAFPSVMHRFLSENPEMYSHLLNILEGRYSYQKLIKDVAVELPKYYLNLPKYHFNRTGQIRE